MISHDEIIQTLKQHRISATCNRIKILSTAHQLRSNISTVSVLKAINYAIERTSVYRALRLFCKKGLLAPMANTDRVIEYHVAGLQVEQCEQKMATFICLECGKTDDINISNELLRPQKNMSIREILIKGLCKHCGFEMAHISGMVFMQQLFFELF